MRIQKDAVEIMSKALREYPESQECRRKDDRAAYGFCVACEDHAKVLKVLNDLKTML